jgi:hypothetical protein
MLFPNTNKLHVLAAISSEGLPVLSSALGEDFDIVFCPSMATAKDALDESIDVIVSCVQFDDSRMFDLLRECKYMGYAKHIPFLYIKCLKDELHESLHEAVDIAARSLGGDGFIDLYRWTTRFGLDQSFEELRSHIESLVKSRMKFGQRSTDFCIT